MNSESLLAISPDGNTIVIVTGKSIEVIDLDFKHGKSVERANFSANLQQVKAIAVSDNAQIIALAGIGQAETIGNEQNSEEAIQLGKAEIWQGKEGEASPIDSYNHSRQVTAIAIDAKGDTVVSGTENGNIKLWRREGEVNNSEPEIQELRSSNRLVVNVVAIDPNGKWAASANDTETLLWNLRTPDFNSLSLDTENTNSNEPLSQEPTPIKALTFIDTPLT
ncbi:MAG: hypothetical protein F6K47_33410 [Symploca sp. SIO2E6]|nr:hypothetical protein [Symploca sp. SIO2E6]